MLGYTLALVKTNKAANGRGLGVKLGRVCIRNDVPVQTVAYHFKVSRQTIYNWFSGKRHPQATMHAGIESYITAIGD